MLNKISDSDSETKNDIYKFLKSLWQDFGDPSGQRPGAAVPPRCATDAIAAVSTSYRRHLITGLKSMRTSHKHL